MKLVLITAILIILLFMVCKPTISRMVYSTRVLSKIDNRYYTVRESPSKQEAADSLAMINFKIIQLIHSLMKNKDDRFKKQIYSMNNRYDPDSLYENVEQYDTSFTVNKGESIHFCLSTRDKHSNVYDINLMLFVAIHELAHVGCESIGHTEEFNDFFKFLLEKAVNIGVYKYQDYSKNEEEYCGITINSTPLNIDR